MKKNAPPPHSEKTGSTQRIIFDIKWCYTSTFYFEKKVYNLNRYGNLFEREREREKKIRCATITFSAWLLWKVASSCSIKRSLFLPDLPPYTHFPLPSTPEIDITPSAVLSSYVARTTPLHSLDHPFHGVGGPLRNSKLNYTLIPTKIRIANGFDSQWGLQELLIAFGHNSKRQMLMRCSQQHIWSKVIT